MPYEEGFSDTCLRIWRLHYANHLKVAFVILIVIANIAHMVIKNNCVMFVLKYPCLAKEIAMIVIL